MLLEGLEVPPADSPKPAASTVGLDGSEAEQKDNAQPARKKKRSFAQLVAKLPVEQVIVDPAEVVADPAAFVCIGSETTRLLDHVPAQFRQQHIIRRKYVRIAQRHLPPVIAPLMRLQERCIASPRLLANVAASRFEMHLPYYRIEQLYARQGLPVPRQSRPGGRAEIDYAKRSPKGETSGSERVKHSAAGWAWRIRPAASSSSRSKEKSFRVAMCRSTKRP